MFRSRMAIAVKKEFSSKASIASHRWLDRAGYITQHASGVNHYSHLMIRVIQNLENFITRTLESFDANQVELSQLQSRNLWEASGRWESYNNDASASMFTMTSTSGQDFCLAGTAEEAAVEYIKSLSLGRKQFAQNITIFQHSNKFRDELRAAGGLLRGKEFRMMDAYSFSADQAGMRQAYLAIKEAFTQILDALDLEYAFVKADSGNISGSNSEELMVFTDIGSDIIWSDASGQIANEEVADKIEWKGQITKRKALEVGHIFQLDTNYSEKLGLSFTDEYNQKQFVHMNCFGIGTTRLIAAFVEQHHDDYGIRWNQLLSAYDVYITQLGESDAVVCALDEVKHTLRKKGLSFIVDDRDVSNGQKFNEADILGIHQNIIIGKKNAEKGMIEVKNRFLDTRKEVSINEFRNLL